MNEMTDRFDRLERQVRRLRMGNLALALALLATFLLGAAEEPTGEVTLRRIAIVDDENRVRIVIGPPMWTSTKSSSSVVRPCRIRIPGNSSASVPPSIFAASLATQSFDRSCQVARRPRGNL